MYDQRKGVASLRQIRSVAAQNWNSSLSTRMHSSWMLTVRCSGRLMAGGGGMYLGDVCPGGCLSREGLPGAGAGLPCGGVHLSPCGQTPVKTLPFPNYCYGR